MNSKLYYVKARLITLKTVIISWIKFPFSCIKAVYEVIKIIIDNPNRWDRYLKFKEIEHNNKIKKEQQEIAMLRIKFIGEICRLPIYALTYCIQYDTANAEEADYKKAQDEFNVTRENIKNQIKELEKRNVVIPSELKTIIESTSLDSFRDLNDWQELRQKLNSILCEMFDIEMIS